MKTMNIIFIIFVIGLFVLVADMTFKEFKKINHKVVDIQFCNNTNCYSMGVYKVEKAYEIIKFNQLEIEYVLNKLNNKEAKK